MYGLCTWQKHYSNVIAEYGIKTGKGEAGRAAGAAKSWGSPLTEPSDHWKWNLYLSLLYYCFSGQAFYGTHGVTFTRSSPPAGNPRNFCRPRCPPRLPFAGIIRRIV